MTSIAIVGAGIGGLAAAIALRAAGLDVQVYEQAPRFARIGAAINLTPNAARVLHGLGLLDDIAARAHRPTYRVNRDWQTGAETSRFPMSETAERRYGAPQLTTHRADLLGSLERAVPQGCVHFGKRLAALSQTEEAVVLTFDDGSSVRADAAIGADGIHSATRTALFGHDAPRGTGVVAYRAFAPAGTLRQYDLAPFTKWWGPTYQSQLVTFLIASGAELFVFATEAQTESQPESWSATASRDDMLAAFRGYHGEAVDILAACGKVLRTPLLERDPLPAWSVGRVTLLGDACHPMMPFMAQGAAMSLEDAAVLSLCLGGVGPQALPAALTRYEALRRPRTARMQIGSRENQILPEGVKADWVYGYDAWTALEAAGQV